MSRTDICYETVLDALLVPLFALWLWLESVRMCPDWLQTGGRRWRGRPRSSGQSAAFDNRAPRASSVATRTVDGSSRRRATPGGYRMRSLLTVLAVATVTHASLKVNPRDPQSKCESIAQPERRQARSSP